MSRFRRAGTEDGPTVRTVPALPALRGPQRIREQFRDSIAAAAVSVVGAGAIALLIHLAGTLAN